MVVLSELSFPDAVLSVDDISVLPPDERAFDEDEEDEGLMLVDGLLEDECL